MYSVFIVDDEIIVREGLRDRIDWKNNNFVFAGEAGDGEVALEKMKLCRPDILITDIKMPFMDGLELSTEIKKVEPGIKIIILSGHDEFEYAKKAISIGVEEYLLKPFTSEELLESVKKIASKLDEEKKNDKLRVLRGGSAVSASADGSVIHLAEQGLSEQASSADFSPAVQIVRGVIEKRYAESDFGLTDAAAEVSLTPNHLSALFSQECGVTFIEYLTSVRIEKARQMLASTEKRSIDICYDVGFNDPHYFSFAFKKATGLSPREWRNSQKM